MRPQGLARTTTVSFLPPRWNEPNECRFPDARCFPAVQVVPRAGSRIVGQPANRSVISIAFLVLLELTISRLLIRFARPCSEQGAAAMKRYCQDSSVRWESGLPDSRRPARRLVVARNRASLPFRSPLPLVLAVVAFFRLVPASAFADEICIRNCFTTGVAGGPELNGNDSFGVSNVEGTDSTTSAQVTVPVDGILSHLDFALPGLILVAGLKRMISQRSAFSAAPPLLRMPATGMLQITHGYRRFQASSPYR